MVYLLSGKLHHMATTIIKNSTAAEDLVQDAFIKLWDKRNNLGDVVRFFVLSGKKGQFSELLLVVGGKDNAIISIRGDINPDEIGKIAKQVDVNVD